jgi:transposase
MSPAYIEAVERNLGKEVIVFDHFHIIKILNDGITESSRDIYNKETDVNKKKL